ncbi:hypothetical protein [Qipengyuania zhejiangensis]|uniref:hypothetical protein n=1 Tax=Qipengyuania zhejiangensis TaxID=3077782 RepID=UPI002D79D4A2|nr:hypothetical protein [Qipengyuania sp. Z2]
MIRNLLVIGALAALHSHGLAQDTAQGVAQGQPERIDILVPHDTGEGPLEDCSEEQENASLSGEIIVCRRRADTAQYGYDKERAERRYARETMNKGDLRTPDVAGPGIFRGPATVSGICGIGLNKCPPPPAYMIDFAALPEAPPGSDADRISRGLPPLGRDAATPRPRLTPREQALGLPPAEPAAEAQAVNPSGSASPEAEPSG